MFYLIIELMKYFICLIVIAFCSINAFSRDIKTIDISELPDSLNKDAKVYDLGTSSYLYYKPKFMDFFQGLGNNLTHAPVEFVKEKNLGIVAGVAASTALFMVYDGKIIDKAQQFGRYIGLKTDNPTVNLSPIGGVPLYVPASLSSGLYYIGDGITELAINSGFYIYGAIAKDNRALRTGIELTEGIATVGVYIQLLKRISGHETPMKRTVENGRWRWFPTIKQYQSSVPKYDAFPSGHLATAMMTVTVISMNYPEYKYIKPLGYSLMAICGYQMLNNGVHWMGDYPLGIAIGYFIGKTAVNNGRFKIVNSAAKTTGFNPEFKINPAYFEDGSAGLSLLMKF